MKNKITRLLFILVLTLSFLSGLVVTAGAQSSTATPAAGTALPITPTPSAAPQSTNLIAVGSNNVTFSQLNQSEIQLTGPYDVSGFTFSKPATWSLTSGAELDLSMSVSFNTFVQGQLNAPVASGGTLTVLLNNNFTLAVIPLNAIGEVQQRIQIPLQALQAAVNGNISLNFILSSGLSCLANQHMNILIHPGSYFVFPHDLIQPDTNLANFPRPIFENSFVEDSAIVIVPDHPSAAELQAAYIVAAGLSNLSSGLLKMDMITVSQFVPANPEFALGNNNHIIFVGNSASLPMLGSLHLPLPTVSGKFQFSGNDQDNGVIQMIDSPWSTAHVVLVVSGNTDQGTIKSAQALSTGVLQPNQFPNLAIVQQVNLTSVPSLQTIDRQLADLNPTQNGLFQGRGVSNAVYEFNMPVGQTVSPDAHFSLVFGNSALLNYDRSGIVVLIDGRPVGSVRFSDITASQAANRVQIGIPSSAVVPGINQLQIRVSLVLLDDCTPVGTQGAWVNVWPDSTLHLPLSATPISPVSAMDLSAYPAPFVYDPVLSSTAIVVPRDDLVSWRSAMQVAASLGSRTNSRLTELTVFYGDDIPNQERAKYNLLVIGRASQLPIVTEINKELPAPFASGSDIATPNNFQVTYQFPADSPMGYVELIPSPWNTSNVVLAALGNTAQGIGWASAALTDPTLSSRLAGNIAVINNNQVVTTDTRTTVVSQGVSPQIPFATAVPNSVNNVAPAQSSRPAWIIPVLVVSIVIILLILVAVLASNRMRNRAGRNKPTGK